jgi:hypothetical protein
MLGALALIVLSVATGTAYAAPAADAPDPSIADGSAATALAAARHLWHAKGYSDYRFVLQRGCFCSPESVQPYTLTVRKRRAVRPPATFAKLATARALFGEIAAGIANGDHRFGAAYDRRTGFPLFVSRDPIAQAVDDEYTLTASKLRRLAKRH